MERTSAEGRRSRGRPQLRSDAETRRVIAEAALDVFVANGYAAANVNDVVKAAAVSKKTIYRLVSTKAELFKASVAARTEQFILAMDPETLAALAPEAALILVLTEYGRLALAEDTLAVQKLVFAESDRFPELAAEFYQGAVVATRNVFVRCLERLRSDGIIDLDDLEDGAAMLRGMMVFEPMRGLMLGQTEAWTARHIETRAQRCARLFIDGCRAAPGAGRDQPPEQACPKRR